MALNSRDGHAAGGKIHPGNRLAYLGRARMRHEDDVQTGDYA